jgi:hypothetical protein
MSEVDCSWLTLDLHTGRDIRNPCRNRDNSGEKKKPKLCLGRGANVSFMLS